MTAWAPLDGGAVQFREVKDAREIAIACGQCIGCRIQRQQMWAFRAVAEASLHDSNWFATLTYSPEFLPPHGSLVHRDWQLFAKRLRKRVGKFRYLMCGEYGEVSGRPHFHALLFGCDLPDVERVRVRRGYTVFRSAVLDRAWSMGLCEIGSVTPQSARYCAGYVLKSGNAPEKIDPESGEVLQLKKPYGQMSLKPGLGDGWVRRFYPELFVHGAAFQKDRRYRIPDRFKAILDEIDPEAFETMSARLVESAKGNPDNTRARLEAREAVQLRRLNHYSEVREHAL